MKLWIDEDLSPSLASAGYAAGYDTTCVRDRGKLRAKDHALAKLVFDEDRVLVTNNAGDFLKLATDRGIHPGLIFLEQGSVTAEQRWLEAALAQIETVSAAAGEEPATFMVNRVVEVNRDGACDDYAWP